MEQRPRTGCCTGVQDEPGSPDQPSRSPVTFYARPGCPFCSALRFRLARRGLAFEEVDIWEDPSAAAFVRSVAGGNETVPTVAVGGHALVNPSSRAVMALVASEAPELLTDAAGGRRGRLHRWRDHGGSDPR